MSMSKRHFKRIAEQFRAEREALERGEYDFPGGPVDQRVIYRLALASMEIRMANICQDSNPRFDRDRFLEACGLRVD